LFPLAAELFVFNENSNGEPGNYGTGSLWPEVSGAPTVVFTLRLWRRIAAR